MNMNGILALVICAFGWSLGGVFIKHIDAGSFTIAGFRSLIAFIVLMGLNRSFPKFLIRKDNPLPSSDNVPSDVNSSDCAFSKTESKGVVDSRQTVYLWLSAICYSATMILYCLGNKMTTAANVIILQYTAPIWVVLFGPVLLHEKNHGLDYLTVAGVIGGMLVFFADSFFGQFSQGRSGTAFWGDILSALSGVTFAFSTIFLRKLKGNGGKQSFALAQMITFVVCLPFVLSEGLLSLESYIFLLLLGVLQMALPNYLYAVGLSKVRALSAVLISMIEPLMNPVWVAIFVHEVPSVTCLIGGVIIIGLIVTSEAVNAVRHK